jgi:hypothetical protein
LKWKGTDLCLIFSENAKKSKTISTYFAIQYLDLVAWKENFITECSEKSSPSTIWCDEFGEDDYTSTPIVTRPSFLDGKTLGGDSYSIELQECLAVNLFCTYISGHYCIIKILSPMKSYAFQNIGVNGLNRFCRDSELAPK